ncbi:hypothetical protein IFR05_004509 [Cadophora sp. M221]|nr:hypothetical protein IFR05_004509 [Cadophora sp. M221]
MSSYSETSSPKDGPHATSNNETIPKSAFTFGVEFEFAIACLPGGFEDPNPEDGRQVYGISERDPGSTSDPYGLHEPEFFTESGGEWMRIQQYIADLSLYNPQTTWIVKNDTSIKFPPLNYMFDAVEVTSPPLYFGEKGLDQVKIACQLLPSKYRLFQNTSCSIHVHVGHGSHGFELAHLRNIMAMLWAFEPHLDSLHPKHRVGPLRYSGFFENTHT